ncbi:MAG: polysaccharide deacetylase family protein [Ferruginibacter sp.]
MILIFSQKDSPRIQYICHFIFQEYFDIPFKVITDLNEFLSAEGAKINYSNQRLSDCFNIANAELLFENTIKPQNIECFTEGSLKAFFQINNSDISFDIFAAAFYLITRYEEYLLHTKDIYGRYAYENSLAWKEGFLDKPVVNYWLNDFSETLKNKFTFLKIEKKEFTFLPTYDIDIAWSYKNKGMLRNVGGFALSPSLERIRVLMGLEKDPFDAYAFLDKLHQDQNVKPLYFFLVAKQKSKYDKNISRKSVEMQDLILHHCQKYDIGLHPSWESNADIKILQEEKSYLEKICGRPIKKSRQHYIQFSLPGTFKELTDAGITDDYSMGYGSINGYRASVASTYFWYNLEEEKVTPLRLHPFCFMEANSYYEQKFSADSAYDELLHYYRECKKINGVFISIFHNNFLGKGQPFNEWRVMYEHFIKEVCKADF